MSRLVKVFETSPDGLSKKFQVIRVDEKDYLRVKSLNWTLYRGKNGRCIYSFIGLNSKDKISIGRFIVGLRTNDAGRVWHKNHNPFDNRRENLRITGGS